MNFQTSPDIHRVVRSFYAARLNSRWEHVTGSVLGMLGMTSLVQSTQMP